VVKSLRWGFEGRRGKQPELSNQAEPLSRPSGPEKVRVCKKMLCFLVYAAAQNTAFFLLAACPRIYRIRLAMYLRVYSVYVQSEIKQLN